PRVRELHFAVSGCAHGVAGAGGGSRGREEARHQTCHASVAVADLAELSGSGCRSRVQRAARPRRCRNRPQASCCAEKSAGSAGGLCCFGEGGTEESAGKEPEGAGK